ncbi:MAG: hypothetical protein CME70_18400 [Halobacteriovorax sp.]|nr:hypothetical protein [Halobacteriovorax sp.]
MSIPVYVKPVAVYPHRTVWAGGTYYVIDDRVEYDDGALHRVYVCITDNNSTTTPDNDPSNWAPAGTKEHPFMSGDDGELAKADYSESELCLRGANGFTQWDPARSLSVSDGSTRAHVILMDGRFHLHSNEGYGFWDTDFYAENHQNTWIIQRNYDHSSFTDADNCPTFNNLKIAYLNGFCCANRPVIYKSCYITDDSPWGYASNNNLRMNDAQFTQAFDTTFVYLHSSINLIMYNMGESATHGYPTLSGCTWYMAETHGQFSSFFYGGPTDINISNCIFYVDTLNSATQEYEFFKTAAHKAKNNSLYFKNVGDQAGVYLALGNPTDLGGNELNSNPLFIDSDSADAKDFRLRPASPLIGGEKSSKFPSDAVWMQAGSGTGTGTESDPYYFSEFTDVLIAAVSTNSKEVVCKDGDYRFTMSDAQFADENLGLVTFIAENRHKAVLSGDRGINEGSKSSVTLKLKDFKLTIGAIEHFIHTQFVTVPSHFTFDNCYINFETFMAAQPGSSLIAKSCIIEKGIGISAGTYFYSGASASGLYTNCTFVDRNSYTTAGWNHGVTGGMQTFKNCIFRTENTSNATPATGTFTQCIAYNYNTSAYGDTEVLNADPLMVNFDISSHEDSDYRLRPSSPAIGGLSASPFPNGSIWVANTAGTGGTGTEEDPYYFGNLDQAHTDAGSYGSIVFKNGAYDTGAGMHIFNPVSMNNSVNYYAETIGGVEFISESFGFGHSGLNVTQSLNYAGLKFTSTKTNYDGVIFNQSTNNSIAAHVFSSCRFQTNHSFFEGNGTSTDPGKIIFKSTHFSKLSATASPYLFEQRNGNSGNSELLFENCIVENFLSTSSGPTQIFRRMSPTLRNTIILDYSNDSTDLVIEGTSNLEGLNSILHENGTDFYPDESNLAVDPLFVSPVDDNWSLRPNSPLVGRG